MIETFRSYKQNNYIGMDFPIFKQNIITVLTFRSYKQNNYIGNSTFRSSNRIYGIDFPILQTE